MRHMKLHIPEDSGQARLIMQRGGRREGAGRKPIGETKRVAVTMPPDEWMHVQRKLDEQGITLAEYFRRAHYASKYRI